MVQIINKSKLLPNCIPDRMYTRNELISDRGDGFCGDSGMIVLIVDAPNRLYVLDSMLLHLGRIGR
jgi:hypothetical protein